MKWFPINQYKPSHDGVFIVRIESDSESGEDAFFDTCEYLSGHWNSCFTDEHSWITHFLIPDAIEIYD